MLGRMPRWLLLLPFCGVLFFHGLNSGPLLKTEGLRALVAAEMLHGGDWLVPSLCGEPLLTKPPLGPVAVAAASWPIGEVRPWSARLPSAVAATLTVLLVYALFRRALGEWAGLTAALILPASVLWLDRAPSADLDMLQVAWVTAAIVCLYCAVEDAERDKTHPLTHDPTPPKRGRGEEEKRPGRQFLWWTLALLAVAGGFLTKWTAPAFFYLTAVPLLWWRRRLSLLWKPPHLIAVALAASICLGWAALAIHRAGWDTFRDTVGGEAMSKLVPGQRSRPYPWLEVLTHPLSLLAANLPWSAAALLTLRPGFANLWDANGRRLLQLLHCWTWPSLLFWSLVPVHAARHSFPLVPGLAGLGAMACIAWLRGLMPWRLPRVSPRAVLVALLVLWIGVKLAFVQLVVPLRSRGLDPEAKGAVVADNVPPDQRLYLFRLKDETLLYYSGRQARRLLDPKDLPSSSELVYCILTEAEWRRWPATRPAEVLAHLADVQGAPLVLVRLPPAEGNHR
jgi:4-amino-4-deoxy-L-arabinose transferase-like glycosyltransferase